MTIARHGLVLVCVIAWSNSYAESREDLLRELQEHQARDQRTWDGWSEREMRERIVPAPEVVIDYLRKDNAYNGWKERPERAPLDPAFHADVIRALTTLPEEVREHFNDYAVGVFLVQQLGGTAYVESLREFEKTKRGFIVLDVEPLKKTANDWATWKESSPFAGGVPFRLKANIEAKASDDRIHAVQYILLHEIGHLVGLAKSLHPSWMTGGDPEKAPFSRLSWRSTDDGYGSIYDQGFESRKRVRYYKFQDATLRSDDIPGVYQSLLQTDFVSLYAATTMYDDFAETYAMFVHVVLQHRPWTLTIKRKSETILVIDRPILEDRCATKRRFLNELFGK